MKFTKREIRNIEIYYDKVKKGMKIAEDKPNNKTNLIFYGYYTGRIHEIVYKKISFNDIEKNNNADQLIKETFGNIFFNWLIYEHKKFTYEIKL